MTPQQREDADRVAIEALQTWFDELRATVPCFRHLADCNIALHHDRRTLANFNVRAGRSACILCSSSMAIVAGSQPVCSMKCAMPRSTVEADPHNSEWRKLMWAAGVNPDSHSIIAGSAFDLWWRSQNAGQ